MCLGLEPRGHSTTGGEGMGAGKQEQLGHSGRKENKILLGPVTGCCAGPVSPGAMPPGTHG